MQKRQTMKKIFYTIPILVIVALAVVFFTPFGSNSVVKPLINSYLAKKLPSPKVKVTKLDSMFNTINLAAIADNGVSADVSGDVNYLGKKFDLNYHTYAKGVKVANHDIAMDMDVKGQAVGTIQNFGLNGYGHAFESDINYKLIIKNQLPQTITASLNSARIAKMFALANQPPLLDGLLFIDANMPSLDIKNPSGKADIKVEQGRFNQRLIAKEYKIKLPKDEHFKANLHANVDKKYIVAHGDINTTSAKLQLTKLTTTLDFKRAKGYYRLFVPNLQRLEGVAKTPLRGTVSMWGAFYHDSVKKITQLNAISKSFGGLLKVKYSNKTLKVFMKNLSVVKILRTLAQPYFVSQGVLSGWVVLVDYKRLNGKFNLTSRGVLNKKLLKATLPNYKYTIKTRGEIKNNILYAQKTDIETNFLKATLSDTRYAILTGALTTDFYADIANLAALHTLTKSALQGALRVNGRLKSQGDNVSATFSTKSLKGLVKGEYTKDRLKATLNAISLTKLLYMLKLHHYIQSGTASGDFKLTSITKGDGLFNIQSKGALDTQTVKKLHKIDLGSQFKYSLLIKNGLLKKHRIITRPQLLTSYGSVDFDYFNYTPASKTLSAKYQLSIDNLAKLESLVGQKLNGSFLLKGKVRQTPDHILATGSASELNGIINFILEDNILKVDAAGVSVVQLLKMLNYEQSIDGVAKANLTYNTKTQKGNFRAILNEARFLNSQLVNTLKQVASFDVSQELFSKADISGVIDKNIITFSLRTSSQKTKIVIEGGVIDTKAQTIRARIVVTLNRHDYIFKLSGPLKSPHIKLSFSGAVQKKVFSVLKKKLLGKDNNGSKIEKIIPKELKEKNLQQEIQKVVPKEVKGLFNLLQ